MAGRGELTKDIQDLAKKFLGREITAKELWLYPYMSYVLMNERKLSMRYMNDDDYEVLRMLEEEGHVKHGLRLQMTMKFWTFMHTILWSGYTDYDGRVTWDRKVEDDG